MVHQIDIANGMRTHAHVSHETLLVLKKALIKHSLTKTCSRKRILTVTQVSQTSVKHEFEF